MTGAPASPAQDLAGTGGGLGYAPPWWLGGGAAAGHWQTIWPALYARRHAGPAPVYRRERWCTPDDDFIDVDWLAARCGPLAAAPGAAPAPAAAAPAGGRPAPLLVLFHGLEGSSRSAYAVAMADACAAAGWHYAVPHWRGCSGEINRAPRAYHSGDFEEIGWILARMRARHAGPLLAAGVSLGGNALLRWAEEAGGQAARVVSAIAAVSAPLDLMAAGLHLGRGFNRVVYTRMFLRTMQAKAEAKLRQFPGLFDGRRMRAARDLWQFDDAFTAPLHGFRGVPDYWRRGSALPSLAAVRVPALVLNARNDPFVPPACLPLPGQAGAFVQLWQPRQGGHAGFAEGRWPPGHVTAVPREVLRWMAKQAG